MLLAVFNVFCVYFHAAVNNGEKSKALTMVCGLLPMLWLHVK